jgi:hypothetical protein
MRTPSALYSLLLLQIFASLQFVSSEGIIESRFPQGNLEEPRLRDRIDRIEENVDAILSILQEMNAAQKREVRSQVGFYEPLKEKLQPFIDMIYPYTQYIVVSCYILFV